ncbi:MAG: GNAT family N-acetyltransferase [Bacteroidota bacterium]|nr:GNAT family N-acetyltransferase [Bacteroidota bacterium]MDQ6888916.1 GNAT family N-acetyltransferase [Bacteroidota bacterium]
MVQILIRKATLEDLAVLLRFEQGVIKAERPFDTTLKEDPIHYYDIREMIVSPGTELVVAVLDHEIVGSGYARIEHSKPYLKHSKYAYLGFMYVDPGHRGKGVIQKIIETLKQWAFAQNIKELRLKVYDNNLSALKAYEKAGFARHIIEMRLETGNE